MWSSGALRKVRLMKTVECGEGAEISNPPKSWTVLPLGNSDDPESKHFDDQAEKLFSKGQMKPTYFLDKEELMKHVESTKVLTWAAN